MNHILISTTNQSYFLEEKRERETSIINNNYDYIYKNDVDVIVALLFLLNVVKLRIRNKNATQIFLVNFCPYNQHRWVIR